MSSLRGGHSEPRRYGIGQSLPLVQRCFLFGAVEPENHVALLDGSADIDANLRDPAGYFGHDRNGIESTTSLGLLRAGCRVGIRELPSLMRTQRTGGFDALLIVGIGHDGPHD